MKNVRIISGMLIVEDGLNNRPDLKERLANAITGLQSIYSDDNTLDLCDSAIRMSFIMHEIKDLVKDINIAYNTEGNCIKQDTYKNPELNIDEATIAKIEAYKNELDNVAK